MWPHCLFRTGSSSGPLVIGSISFTVSVIVTISVLDVFANESSAVVVNWAVIWLRSLTNVLYRFESLDLKRFCWLAFGSLKNCKILRISIAFTAIYASTNTDLFESIQSFQSGGFFHVFTVSIVIEFGLAHSFPETFHNLFMFVFCKMHSKRNEELKSNENRMYSPSAPSCKIVNQFSFNDFINLSVAVSAILIVIYQSNIFPECKFFFA